MNKLALVLLLTLFALINQAQVQRVTFQLNKKTVLAFEQAAFQAKGKALTFDDSEQSNGSKFLIAINGKPVFGADGEVPEYVLAKATLFLNGRTHHLPTDGMYNPWSKARMSRDFVRLTQQGGSFKIQAVFSDGAGSYLAEWKIAGTTATRTLLTADDELVTGFFKKSSTKQ